MIGPYFHLVNQTCCAQRGEFMSTQDYIQAAKSIFAAFMRGDMDDFVAAMAEDVVFVSDPGTDDSVAWDTSWARRGPSAPRLGE